MGIPKLSKELAYVKALPEICAYTNINYFPAFYKKKKVNPLLSIRKKQTFMDAFVTLGNSDLSEKAIPNIEEITCHVHDYPKKKSINDVSKVELNKKSKQKQGKNPLDFIKSADATTLPPCSKVFLQQIKLESYVEYPYSISYDGYPNFDLFPIGYGCKLSENGESLKMHWFDDS